MNIKIKQLGTDRTVAFAVEELMRYLRQMVPGVRVSRLIVSGCDATDATALWVGCDPVLGDRLPAVRNARLDDAICIHVVGGAGVITGSNARSVLIAVYRYLRELGCKFLRPGRENEVIPTVDVSGRAVQVVEAASYRHREVCIEGADAYEHVADMIDWLPKVGMNGYFVQFAKPYQFFRSWYTHAYNPTMEAEPMSDEEIDGMYAVLREEIVKRGLLYHAVGHSWTCEPYGVPGTGWDAVDVPPPPEMAPYIAEVGGRRDWWGGVPLNTNLCYSSPEVRERLTDAIVRYCEENPAVDFLHFWLADSVNSHCECSRCVLSPTDYYVMMLNELDAKLTRKGIDTHIVFLIYFDLLWAPEGVRIEHPERFTLMFAPITRTYSRSFTVAEEEVEAVRLPPYEKNRLVLPRSVAENAAHLRSWQATFRGDSFDFDYHMMWDHYNDPGNMETARGLSEDMKNLWRLGLDGMNSCQVQRAFFPTALNMMVMAATLWDREVSFEAVVESYLTGAFGTEWRSVRDYLSELSRLFDPVWQRGEMPAESAERAAALALVPALVDGFRPTVRREMENEALPAAVRRSWAVLWHHADVCVLFAAACRALAEGDREGARGGYEALMAHVHRIEPEIHAVFDPYIFDSRQGRRFR